MKIQIISILIFFVLLISCKEENRPKTYGNIIISGKIINDTSYAKIHIVNYLRNISGELQILPNINGNFKAKLQTPSELEIILFYKDTYARLLLKPNDSIFLIFDANTKEYNVSGENATFQNRLRDVEKVINESIEYQDDYQSKSQELNYVEYLNYRSLKLKNNLKSLNDILPINEATFKLKKFYNSKFKMKYCLDLMYFSDWYSIYQGGHKMHTDYLNSIDSIYNQCSKENYINEFGDLVIKYSYLNLKGERNDSLSQALKVKDRRFESNILFDYYQTEYSGLEKDYLITTNLISLINDGYVTDDIFFTHTNNISSTFFNEYLTKKYHLYKLKQKKEIDSNRIQMIDLRLNDSVSLFKVLDLNHKGKVCYVDIWATWCGSCINNFLYSSELLKHFPSDKIDFIYIAINSPQEQWEKVVKNYKLEGIHYLINGNQRKELNKIIQYQSIPHYFILNRNTKVIDFSARSPKNEDLLVQLADIIKSE